MLYLKQKEEKYENLLQNFRITVKCGILLQFAVVSISIWAHQGTYAETKPTDGDPQFLKYSSHSSTNLDDFSNTSGMKPPLQVCPRLCICKRSDSSNAYHVTCKGGRKALPGFSPNETTKFVYTFNTLPNNTLTRDSVVPFVNVTTLNLSNNKIKLIQRDSFISMTHLSRLYLDNNFIVRQENQGILNPEMMKRISVLSLRNVLPEKSSSCFLWAFLANEASNSTICGERITEKRSRNYTRFRRLTVMQLDQNRLDCVDEDVIGKTGMLDSLETLGLSGNFLTQRDLLRLLKLINESNFTQIGMTALHQSDENQDDQEDAKQQGKVFQLDMSSNQISVINETILNFFKKPTTSSLTNDVQLRLKIFLHDNPIRCSCSVLPFMDFLFNGSKNDVVADYKLLSCKLPKRISGLELQRLHKLPNQLKICEEKFRLTGTQITFITVFGILLSFVSLTVAYLNRYKIALYFNFIRNRGDSEVSQTTVRWRNNMDKYSIPRDHKGVGHQGYHVEDEPFSAPNEDKKH